MLARRIISVSSDAALGEQLEQALTIAGVTVESHRELATLQGAASLFVLHCATAEELAQLAAILPRLEGRIVVVLPRAGLGSVVTVMQASTGVVGVVVAEELDARGLNELATRIVTGEVFGLEAVVARGTPIHTLHVIDYGEKAGCMKAISEVADRASVPRKMQVSIEQCVDEMLMNALYDAPVDDAGAHIFAGVETKQRVGLRIDQTVVVQYACDGRHFAVCVRDAFGSLARDTVLRFLGKSLDPEVQIDRKAGGAGVGLYLMVSSASAVTFSVIPRVATQALCMFDLAGPKLRLAQFGFLEEASDASGVVASDPPRKSPGTPRLAERPKAPLLGRLGPSIAIGLALACVVVAGLALWPRSPSIAVTVTTVPGATILVDGREVGVADDGTLAVPELEAGKVYAVAARRDGYRTKQTAVMPHGGANAVALPLVAVAGTLAIESEPSGARVDIDGTRRGETPFITTALASGATVAVVIARRGYRDASVQLVVPAPGETKRHVQKLELSDKFARIRFVSTPPGARIVQLTAGEPLETTFTPAEIVVEANKPQRFKLTMPRRKDLVIEPFTAVPGARLEKGGVLAE